MAIAMRGEQEDDGGKEEIGEVKTIEGKEEWRKGRRCTAQDSSEVQDVGHRWSIDDCS